jgi:hypothetical protein
MSGYESPTPAEEETGAMGAGTADGTDLEPGAGGDATGGGSPGDPDAMGADDSPQPGEAPAPETTDGEVPDADIALDDPSGGEARHGRT